MDERDHDKINDIERDLVGFTAKVTEWMNSTTEYRKSLCSKIDDINKKLDETSKKFADLPCRERSGWHTSVNRQLNFIWLAVGGVILKLVADWVQK